VHRHDDGVAERDRAIHDGHSRTEHADPVGARPRAKGQASDVPLRLDRGRVEVPVQARPAPVGGLPFPEVLHGHARAAHLCGARHRRIRQRRLHPGDEGLAPEVTAGEPEHTSVPSEPAPQAEGPAPGHGTAAGEGTAPGGTDGRSPGLSRRAKQALGAAGGAVAVLVGVTTLVDWVQGKIDDPPPPPPPATIDPRIEKAELQLRNERLIDYLRDTNQPTGGLTRREREERGLRFVVRVRLRGTQGAPMPLRWQMYDERAGRLRDPIYSQSPVTFTPTNQDHARTVPLWLPYPPKTGRYVVRFALLDPKREPLDDVAVRFAVGKVPALE
jgi:hypothetical protein